MYGTGLYRLWKRIRFLNQFCPSENIGLSVVLQVLNLKVFFKFWPISEDSQGKVVSKENKTSRIPSQSLPVKSLWWCCCDSQTGIYSGSSQPSRSVFCYYHQSPLILSISLSGLLLKLNRFLLQVLLPLPLYSIISEEVVKKNLVSSLNLFLTHSYLFIPCQYYLFPFT